MANELQNLTQELSKPSERTVVRIEQFGGIRRDGSPSGRTSPISDCTSCLNVHSAGGGIEVRPGYVPTWTRENGYGVTPALDSDYHTMESWYIDDKSYLFLAFRTAGQIRVRMWDENSSVQAASGTAYGHADGVYYTPSIKTYNKTAYVACGGIDPALADATDAAGNVYCSFKMYQKGGEWVRRQVGITPPNEASEITITDVTPSGGSWHTGDAVSYRHTFYNQTTDTESSPCRERIHSILENWRLIRYAVNVPTGTDPQVTHIRLYRKIVAWAPDIEGRTEAGQDSWWYWIGDIPVPEGGGAVVDHWDRGQVARDGYALELSPADYYSDRGRLNLSPSTPPQSSCIELYRNRMWWVEQGTNKVRWSEPYRPEQVYPTNSIAAGDPDEEIVGIKSAYDRLFIFKRSSIYYLSGSTPQSYSVSLLPGAGSIGCMNKNTIIEGPDGLYIADITGIYRLTGSGLQLISPQLRDFLDQEKPTDEKLFLTRSASTATAAFDYERGLYILSGTHPSPSYLGWSAPSNQLVYSIGMQSWYKWDMPFWCMHTWRTKSGMRVVGWLRKPEGLLDNNTHPIRQNGKIAWVRGTSDISTGDAAHTWDPIPSPIAWEWHMPPSDMRTTKDKQIHYWRMSIDSPSHSPNEADYTLGDYVQGAANTDKLGSEPAVLDLESKNRVGQVMDTIQISINGATKHASSVVAIELDTPEVIGHD